jgi:signal transduction histidine kinase
MNGVEELAQQLMVESKDVCSLMQAIVDAVIEPILIISKDYQVWLLNKAASDSYLSDAGNVPLYCYQLTHRRETPCDGAAHPCPLEEVQASQRPTTVVHEHFISGEKRFVEIIAAPLWAQNGELVGIVESERDITERRQIEVDLRDAVRKLRSLYSENLQLTKRLREDNLRRGELLKAQITAQEEERKRVARELHDELGQALGGLAFQIGSLEGLIKSDPKCAIDRLEGIRELVSRTTDRMYDIILALRPTALDDLGLVIALRTVAERVLSVAGISFEINVDGIDARLPAELEIVLYRVCQEALNNVLKHSRADHVTISLSQNEDRIEVEIMDNGTGFDPEAISLRDDAPHGLGLLGMQERVNLCGGTLEVLSHPGVGTLVRVRISQLKETWNDRENPRTGSR